MKTKLTFFLLIFVQFTFAQFPAPTNFSLQGKYILLGECDDCLIMHLLCGPTYCSLFSWQQPTETTTATFEHYNVYGKYDNKITFLESETKLSHWAQIPPQGDFWVTAVYSNPAGESLPSNVAVGWDDLPTSNKMIETVKDNILFSKNTQNLTISSNKILVKMNLINSNGKIISCILNPSKNINISELPRGFYIVEIYCENSEIIRKKIIK